jgi:hypothetical protein
MGKGQPVIHRLLIAVVVCGQSAGACALADLRDIRGPAICQGLPPFTLTVLALLLGGFCLFMLRRLSASHVTPGVVSSCQLPFPATLADLKNDFESGQITLELLFTRLAALINGHLAMRVGCVVVNLTTDEMLGKAALALPPQELLQVSGVLHLCDRVKFAAHQPSGDDVGVALDMAATILSSRTGEGVR